MMELCTYKKYSILVYYKEKKLRFKKNGYYFV